MQGIRDRNTNVNFQDFDNRTYIRKAADEGKATDVRILLNKGATPNLRDTFSQTALDCAMRRNNPAVVSVLTEYYAVQGP